MEDHAENLSLSTNTKSFSPASPGERDNVSCAVAESAKKLELVAESLRPWIGVADGMICLQPCRTDADLVGYRSKCSFQIVQNDINNNLAYAVRESNVPTVVASFPAANRRIQMAMAGLLEALNSGACPTLSHSLASVTFSSSWSGAADAENAENILVRSDCLVTLNYDQVVEDAEKWQVEAGKVCGSLAFSQITGRSRKRILRAFAEPRTLINDSIIIRDKIWLIPPPEQVQEANSWGVQLFEPKGESNERVYIPVEYAKPEGAFYHPNARVMCSALEWMLSRIGGIGRNLRLLEMYCGCGAHTVALARSGMFRQIDAVELDQRLVDSCRYNCQLNNVSSVVSVYSSDASEWARQFEKRTTGSQHNLDDNVCAYDILLVDPPKQGLTNHVCQMAQYEGSFEHFLYISCGRDALVRDLERLSGHFAVVDCTLLDLFPGTYSVESLVHLRRRRRRN